MASFKNYLTKPTHRGLINPEPMFEFDESDLWNSNEVPISNADFKKSQIRSGSKVPKKKSTKLVVEKGGLTASSVPINIPDWSKILKDDYNNRRVESDHDEDVDDEDMKVPPHEFLARQFARTGVTSFSVHEGFGRTLKGRDLSRVRDAIWKQTGFED
ncbi:hypothetical protein IFM89_034822 [Coptis chinensis]|uniref:Senescence regulator n=1 Tax=Coptis chinensis TaxID=261450 RepID=A0A835H8P2_9MAGN|nr:hypothetical protein IFM89_034822 [Coptis chinensis]